MIRSICVMAAVVWFIVPQPILAAVTPIQPSDFAAGRTVVDFESPGSSLPIVPGVQFLNEFGSGSGLFQSDVFPGGFFGQQGWGSVGGGDLYSNMGAAFSPPVAAFGGWFGQPSTAVSPKAGEMEVRIFDKNSALVGDSVVQFPNAIDTPVWVGFLSDTLIKRVEFLVTPFSDRGYFAGDNFTFGSTVVPEPSMMALLASGITICLLCRSRGQLTPTVCGICSFIFFVIAPRAAPAAVIPIQPGDFAASAIVVTFETAPMVSPLGSFVPGMTFLADGSSFSLDWFFCVNSGGGFFGSSGMSNVGTYPYSNLGAEFTPPVQAVGGWFGQVPTFSNVNAGEMEVRVYDKDSLLVSDTTVNFIHALHSPVWVGYESDTLISRIEYRVSQFPDAGFFGGDNLTFGSVVPEPATLALLPLGAAFGATRHKRRK